MINKVGFNGTSNPHFRVYILSQAVKHKSFPFDKSRRKHHDAEMEGQVIFLGDYSKNVA